MDSKSAEDLEKKYDSGLALRPHGPLLAVVLFAGSVLFAAYHYLTAYFGIPVDYWHMGIHLSGLSILIFTGFPMFKWGTAFELKPNTWWRWGNVPVWDWVFAVSGVCAALYLGFSWNGLDFSFLGQHILVAEQALRQGDPETPDIVLGTILVVLALEMARRALGIVLPLIISVFIAYALLGPYMPVQILQHPGVDWRQFINNMYFPQEGIFGVTLWVVSTVVFHFVLFGVIAQRMGLGQFFVDNAMILAGRYTGGPAKVSVVSSAFFGTISGSSIANTVSTGSLTIPNMKRLGYPGHFAGGVEAAASAGGQITPPIMGAASFLMAEFLEVPYTTIVVAAIVPAAMHYVGVMSIVHFEARRLGLQGYPKEMLPNLIEVWAKGWPTVVPLVILIAVLFTGFTPYYAAFWGITACIVVGLLNPRHRMSVSDIIEGFTIGVKYALAVGAAATAVGIVVGVINTTGVAFRLGFMVTSGAQELAENLYAVIGWIPLDIFSQASIQLFLSLVFIAVACIMMGAGLPTTALYIMLVSVAQPALAQLGVPALASHMFVLYYGVISEITPPVCASAYAAAGIAGANPFRTGVSAFTLGVGKLMVPMVFVYAPTMLIVLPEYYSLGSFIQVSLTCALGIFLIAQAVTGFCLTPMNALLRLVMGVGGLMLVAPSTESDLWSVVFVVPVVVLQWLLLKRRQEARAFHP
ncbi:MAG: TRAP transporter permease [Rhodobacterales bacterium]|nr:TRAP transporter permease [Rhodobacterales bacterium]